MYTAFAAHVVTGRRMDRPGALYGRAGNTEATSRKEAIRLLQKGRGTSFDVASVVGRPEVMQFRTTEDGLVLQTNVLTRNDSMNGLGKEIQAHNGQLFLTRTNDDRLVFPTAHYYHIATTPLAADATDVDLFASNLPKSHLGWTRGYVAPPIQGAFFYLIQGTASVYSGATRFYKPP